jgi:3-deoxy-D-manno-octulosonic-acid transferase
LAKFFYQLFLFFYPLGIKLASLWNEKARKWLQGRQNWQHQLTQQIRPNTPYIWMHCASLGEFEQGRPLMEAFKQQYPQTKMVLSFFSPSGYEVQKNYSGADIVCYLPMDSAKNARQFIDLINPSLVLFVKYEFWHYYLQAVQNKNIPLYLISGIFRPHQSFFKWHGQFYRNILGRFNHFFLQDEGSAQLLQSIGLTNYTVCGDTRFDRVITIANSFEPIPAIEAFINLQTTIVAGSTWTEDDEELNHFANKHPQLKFIIAPHNINQDRIEECLKLYKNSITVSQWIQQQDVNHSANILIVDNVGMLSKLYKYGTICYVGGGFGDDGVHNVLEAAVYNKPVIFGPVFEKYIEAAGLESQGGGFSIDGALELEALITKLLTDQPFYQAAAQKAGAFVASKTGASKAIMNYLQIHWKA